MDWLWQSLYHAAAMLWETLWALVLGFSLVSAQRVCRQYGQGFEGVHRKNFADGLIKHLQIARNSARV